MSRGENRPEPHHYAKKAARRQWRNSSGVYSWLPAGMACQKPVGANRSAHPAKREANASTKEPTMIR
jgi:hypothetical protein